MFSNTWGTTVFLVLHLFALALCFSMSRGRPFHVFKLYFSVLAKKRPKPFIFPVGSVLGKPILGTMPGREIFKKRSHAAWRSFRFLPKRSHAAWRSFLDF